VNSAYPVRSVVGYRLRSFTLAEKLGNVSRACRLMGVHRSTYYRLKKQVDRWGWRR
jgi:DNA-binding protein Fis